MSTLAITHPTLLDFKKTLDPNGQVAQIIEILSEQNPIIQDIPMLEANGPTSHRTTIRSGLPESTWKKLNYGVQPSKARSLQVTDTIGHLYQIAEVDADLAELNGNSASFMLQEHLAHIESMNQEFASTLFYGNEGTDPAEFTGLAPRFNSQSAENGGNILTSAATPDSTDNTSLWLIGWSPLTIHGVYPKGSQAGLQITDYGKVMSENQGGSGLMGQVYRRLYSWKVGLCVRDWRYIVRINFDLEDAIEAATSGPVLYNLMVQAIHLIPSLGMCRPVFYGNRDALSILDRQMMNKSNLGLTTVQAGEGKAITTFRGIPVKRCDAILSTESGI